nr:hypothetical protein [Treponema sp.]
MDLLTVPAVFDYDLYLNEIKSLFADIETFYYLDTCFLSQMYKLKESIRKDFYKWINSHIKNVRVPYWVYCEYTKRAVNNNGLSEFYPLSDIQSKVNAVASDFQLLKDFADIKTVKSMGYNTLDEFFAHVTDVSKEIEKVANSFRINSDIQEIREEVNGFLSKITLKNEIKITENLINEFEIRRENKIPPGFDETKQKNVIGDFIVWKEILNDIKNNNYTKVIFLTNDMKKDWVYIPQQIIYKGQRIPNQNKKDIDPNLVAKIVDPRLEKEVYDLSNTQSFYIVNFKMFSFLLSDMYPTEYSNFANYVTKNEEETTTVKENDDGLTVVSDSNIEDKVDENILGIKPDGIADGNAKISLFLDYQKIINGFKSYNWYIQSRALFDAKKLDFTKTTSTEQFVLGRNIYQSACGGENDASFMLNNPVSIFSYFTNDIARRNIVMGMLFEVYFDSRGEVRKELKNKFLQKMFQLDSVFSDEFKKVGKYLKLKSNAFIYYPGDGNTQISINIHKSSDADKGNHEIIDSIIVNGYEILSDTYNEKNCVTYFSLTRCYYSFD